MEPISPSSDTGAVLLSHPDRSLCEHLQGCDKVSALALEQKYVADVLLSASSLEHLRKLLVWCHDLGKATVFFQHYLSAYVSEDDPMFGASAHWLAHAEAKHLLDLQPSLSNHALLGACVVPAACQEQDELLKAILFKIIRRHHGDMTNFLESAQSGLPEMPLQEEQQNQLQRQQAYLQVALLAEALEQQGFLQSITEEVAAQGFTWRPLMRSRASEGLVTQLKKQETLRYFFVQHFLYSLLLSADKGDVMLRRQEDTREQLLQQPTVFLPGVVDTYKRKLFGQPATQGLNALREQTYWRIAETLDAHPAQAFFSITLPTGMGKTLSALRAAFQLQGLTEQQYGKPFRVVYCLPFTSIIDQNAAIVEDILQVNGLDASLMVKHHHLSDLPLYDKQEALMGQEGEYLTEGWQQSMVVTTFVQLLQSIFTNRNRSIRKFHNLVNSVIVLDEVQNIPACYHEAVAGIMRDMHAYFGTRFIFVTATQPLLLDREEVVELTDPTRVFTREVFEQQQRIQMDASRLGEDCKQVMEESDILSALQQDIASHDTSSFLVICNTVAQSQRYFEYLASRHADTHRCCYLSSGVLPRRRKQLIALIRRWQRLGIPHLVVATQVVEAGVDIDMDIVWRDFAPLDSINQSAGRCNRNAKKGKGTVRLFNSGKGKRIYDPVLLDATRKVLRETLAGAQTLEESDFYQLNEAYFTEVYHRSAKNSDASAYLLQAARELRLEDIQKKFVLIDELGITYDVFIPYNQHAARLWEQYEQTKEITDHFERKRAVKRLMPALLQYVTKIPKQYYPNAQVPDGINKADDWQQFYDLRTGLIREQREDETLFF